MKEHFNFHSALPLHLAAIKPKQADFCLSVFKILQEKLNISRKELQNISFLLAISGGVDSVAMLAIFKACQQYFGYTLHVAHFNHGIREESAAEEKLVQKICKRLDIPLTMDKGNTPLYAKEHKIGLEEAGRILRYAFFSALRQKEKNCILCTAHHANDLCEDMLMRLIRGTAWPQLAGMPYFDPERKLLRPLLYTSKQELSDFAEQLDFPFARDTSNTDLSFLRNRVREQIIPLLEKENPKFYQNILKLKQNAEYDETHFQNETNAVLTHLEQCGNKLAVPLAILQKNDKTIRLHTYRALLKKLGQGHSVTATFEKLDTAVMKNQGSSEFKFSNDARIRIQEKKLYCFIKTNA